MELITLAIEAGAAVATNPAAMTAATVAATAATVSAANKKMPVMRKPSPEPKATEAQLSQFRDEQRKVLKQRRASLATQSSLEEPIVGKQSLLGA